MKKNTFLTTLVLSTALIPFLASAQISATTSLQIGVGQQPTEAQILTACSQSSIEIRDSAIGSARTAYNNSMSIALEARKNAEKVAVAIEDAGDKKDAVSIAVEEYKKSVTQAQDGLTKARKEAWLAFEVNTKGCREISKDKREAFVAEMKTEAQTKDTAPEVKSSLRAAPTVAPAMNPAAATTQARLKNTQYGGAANEATKNEQKTETRGPEEEVLLSGGQSEPYSETFKKLLKEKLDSFFSLFKKN